MPAYENLPWLNIGPSDFLNAVIQGNQANQQRQQLQERASEVSAQIHQAQNEAAMRQQLGFAELAAQERANQARLAQAKAESEADRNLKSLGLGLEDQRLGLEGKRIDQNERFGAERLGIMNAGQDLRENQAAFNNAIKAAQAGNLTPEQALTSARGLLGIINNPFGDPSAKKSAMDNYANLQSMYPKIIAPMSESVPNNVPAPDSANNVPPSIAHWYNPFSWFGGDTPPAQPKQSSPLTILSIEQVQ